ncbi:hypothetical protein PBI_BOGOSYJAY_56 [Mycobacterium phage BogosyJay]|nr:hypothetical protein PBI_MAMINIAINA_56 [Mycobacterium phage Maminiaina]QFG14964.1 hypothetical protein PBI_BOGOSYJAY_56 [Mycobacterium phage BogosyJay]
MSILTKAEEIINGQRAIDYGDALENHQRIATLWNAYLQQPVVDHNDVAVMMILLKIARFMENGYHQDTVVDIAGYAGVLEKMQLPKEDRYITVKEVYTNIEDLPEGKLFREEGSYGMWAKRVSGIVYLLTTSVDPRETRLSDGWIEWTRDMRDFKPFVEVV